MRACDVIIVRAVIDVRGGVDNDDDDEDDDNNNDGDGDGDGDGDALLAIFTRGSATTASRGGDQQHWNNQKRRIILKGSECHRVVVGKRVKKISE
ncbi:hypothetical protein K0M31_007438 [Melipona bicolor]|uniref:Uncharacterized protein n=1 Tax=Melipona bicolor TaxID=60889 RepID=A0AA40GBQ1_9HYME|nr:hypothetical protein K0M31_007438 [Melipona bicolor]